MQLMINVHKDEEGKHEEKEQDVEDKEIFKGVTKRSTFLESQIIFQRPINSTF